MKPEQVQLREILFEFRRVGNAIRISAIDPDSGIEVITVGEPRYGEETLKRIAARKLRYVIAKKIREQRARR